MGIILPKGSTNFPRKTVTYTTAALADGSGESGTVIMAKGYKVLRVETDRACRVRLYTTTAKRDADVSRLATDDPLGDHGCIAEWITLAILLSVDCAPEMIGANMEAAPVSAIAIRVENLSGAAHTVAVTLTFQEQE